MKKIQIHWQILIALILAIIYGIIFPTTYSISDQTLKKLEKKDVSNEMINKLKPVENLVYHTRAEFISEIETRIDTKDFEKYSGKIIKYSNVNKEIDWVSWMGDIFLRALKMLIIPLILSSLIS